MGVTRKAKIRIHGLTKGEAAIEDPGARVLLVANLCAPIAEPMIFVK